jgi:hypothetical protein
MPKADKPKHNPTMRARPGCEAGLAAAEAIVKAREEERQHQLDVLNTRRAAELEAARSSGSADIRYLGEHLSQVVTLLGGINKRLQQIEKHLCGSGENTKKKKRVRG